MASISQFKPYKWRLRGFPNLGRISEPCTLYLLRLLSSTQESTLAADDVSETSSQSPASVVNRRTLLGKKLNPEKVVDIICRMMASRDWRTRWQNSIRDLVPEFDHSLVWKVLHGTKKSEHALQFFRWVERAGLFKHDRETHLKIIEVLGRASKLNHARRILLEMPKKGVRWDEDHFVVLIDSYGKAGIVQEPVKIFNKMKELGVERVSSLMMHCLRLSLGGDDV